ncbi:methylenetetrahydrofolate reductase [Buchnera aphidicola (Formosaphis micheliae)]|uniref:methylenetetrahydrofolate reductase n=1 Tax=Buchnera aphidicola TaxID=9 RepID=UPI0031B898B4
MNFYKKKLKETLYQYITDINSKINISFELFPPKNILLEDNLWSTVNKLSTLKPNFFSVTYGANSGERYRTYDIVNAIKEHTGMIVVPHLTCVDTKKEELIKIAKTYWDNNIRHIIALRGDSVNKLNKSTIYAIDLIKILKNVANFDISVAAYPEVHPEAESSQFDLINLKRKIEAGANRAITQFFFDVECYLRFRDRCYQNGINVQIIPGILPIISFPQLKNFSNMTNVHIPSWIYNIFSGLENDLNTTKMLGASIAINMVHQLYKEGVKDFHFYTLNKSDVVYAICCSLGRKSVS